MKRLVTSSYFALYDIPFIDQIPTNDHCLANFESVTGGDIEVSMISYDLVDGNGMCTEKYMPGTPSYKPITLIRCFDARAEALYKWFNFSEAGNTRGGTTNCSVAMIDMQGHPQVIWNLYNAIPSKISGFKFNGTSNASYANFELTLQSEWFEMRYL
jgi:phage tail-like protein